MASDLVRGTIEVRRTVDLSDALGHGIAPDGSRVPAGGTVTDSSPPGEFDPASVPLIVDRELCPMTGWVRVGPREWRATDPNGNRAVVRLVEDG